MYSPDSVMDVLEAGSVGHGQQSKTECLVVVVFIGTQI